MLNLTKGVLSENSLYKNIFSKTFLDRLFVLQECYYLE